MNTRLLIDGIVRQTMVLLAQLSTAAGVRAPLAHVADEVFVGLAREIEAQGVGRKVAADMFGLALRGYQKKMQRLAQGGTDPARTLWTSILDYVADNGNITRERLMDRFSRDGARDVIGVLTDLVNTGLLHASGRGASAVYGVTSDAERKLYAEAAERDALDVLAWATLRKGTVRTARELGEALRIDVNAAHASVQRLVAQGRAARSTEADDAVIEAVPLMIPLGAEFGWETAVLDHFAAMANAVAAKLRAGSTRSTETEAVGGTTLSFKLRDGHPLRERVLGLLARTRREAIGLWDEVEAYNAAHPFPDDEGTRAWFYVGQYLEEVGDER